MKKAKVTRGLSATFLLMGSRAAVVVMDKDKGKKKPQRKSIKKK